MSEVKEHSIQDKYDEMGIFKNGRFLDFIVVPATILILIVIGHYGLFLGHTFFAEEDVISNLLHNSSSSPSNGWRSDIGLGINLFWGDPGDFHPWAIFKWWGELFDNAVVAYNMSIILLLWGLCVSQYIFLRKALPRLGRVVSTLISPMIAFGSLRHEFLFNRHWISLALCTGPISLLLYEFFQRPRYKHYFIYILILFFSCAFGSLVSLTQTIIFSVLFFIVFVLYNSLNGDSKPIIKLLINYLILNISAGFTLVFLLGWVFFGLFVEFGLVGYVRDPDYTPGSFFASTGVGFAIKQISEYLHAGLFSPWMQSLGLQFANTGSGWNNVSPIFPIVFLIFIFHKSRHFWEFAAKFIVLALLAWQQLVEFAPGIIGILQSVLKLYPLEKFQPVIQVYGIVILGIVVQKLREENLNDLFPKRVVLKCFSVLLALLYAVLFLLAFMALNFSNLLLDGLQVAWVWVVPLIRSETILGLAPLLLKENITLLSETMDLSAIVFYGSTLFFFLVFVFGKWRQFIQMQGGKIFTLALLVNSIFLSWAVFPLNKEPLLWDRQNLATASPPIKIKEFDRIAKVGVESCLNATHAIKIECVKSKYFGSLGARRHVVGYRFSPGLRFSAPKSFTEENVALLITTFLDIEGLKVKRILRHLTWFPAFSSSLLYDFVGVKYFVSPWPLPSSDGLELIHSSFQFYLYRNLDAWPYYYLAERIETIHEMKELYHAEKGVAYLWAKDSESLVFNKSLEGKSLVEFSRFQFGDMELHTSSNEDEFLVIADAWHPFWRAQVDGEETKIIKTNGVFKGVLLPPGNHTIRLFFDNTPYRPGIWISIISWVLFSCAWIWLAHRNPH